MNCNNFIYSEFTVTIILMDNNKEGWSEIDFLKYHIKTNNLPQNTGWYAKKEINGVIYFKITNDYNIMDKKEYLRSYSRDGWKQFNYGRIL